MTVMTLGTCTSTGLLVSYVGVSAHRESRDVSISYDRTVARMVRVRAFLFRLGCGRLVPGTLILLGKEHGCPGVVRIPCVIYIFCYY